MKIFVKEKTDPHKAVLVYMLFMSKDLEIDKSKRELRK